MDIQPKPSLLGSTKREEGCMLEVLNFWPKEKSTWEERPSFSLDMLSALHDIPVLRLK